MKKILEQPKLIFLVACILNIVITFTIFSFVYGPGLQKQMVDTTDRVSNAFNKENLTIKLDNGGYSINKEVPYELKLEGTEGNSDFNLLKVVSSKDNLAEDIKNYGIILEPNAIQWHTSGQATEIPIKSLTDIQNPILIDGNAINFLIKERLDLDGLGFHSFSLLLTFISGVTYGLIAFVSAAFICPWMVVGLFKISGYPKVGFNFVQKYPILFYSAYLVLSPIIVAILDSEPGFLTLIILCFFSISIYLKIMIDKGKIKVS